MIYGLAFCGAKPVLFFLRSKAGRRQAPASPSLESLWDIRGQGGIIMYHPVLPVPIKSDTGHDAMN